MEALLADHLAAGLPGRVVRVERIWCRVVTPIGEIDVRAEVLPAVGDWVVVDATVDEPVVVAVADRWSELTRMDPHGDRLQVLAANIDVVLVTCPADRPSIARVERETVLAWDSGARPVVLVTKSDLDDGTLTAELSDRLIGVDVLPVQALGGDGVQAVATLLAPDRTAVALGPSGAGKSTLINALLGEDRLATAEVRDEDARGRHTTTHRELVPIPTGGVVIDTPGLRSLGLSADMQAGIDATFSEVVELAARCRFADCAHDQEPGCAVTAAVVSGELDADRFASYEKLAREMAYEERRIDPVAARAEREKWKAIQKANRARNQARSRSELSASFLWGLVARVARHATRATGSAVLRRARIGMRPTLVAMSDTGRADDDDRGVPIDEGLDVVDDHAERFVDRFAANTVGAFTSASMVGLAKGMGLHKETEEVAVIREAGEPEPDPDDPIEVAIDPDHPENTRIVFHVRRDGDSDGR